MTQLHDPRLRGFASDNYAGVHPEVLAAIAEANGGHQIAYGEDVYTARLQEVMREHFGDAAEAFPVFNGTGANVTALTSVLPRWGAVVSTSTAHIHTGGQRLEIPCVEAEAVVDPTGCGDAYRAGLLYGIGAGWDWVRTGRLASLMGALKIAHRGGQNHAPTRDAIAARYQQAFADRLW